MLLFHHIINPFSCAITLLMSGGIGRLLGNHIITGSINLYKWGPIVPCYFGRNTEFDATCTSCSNYGPVIITQRGGGGLQNGKIVSPK